MLLSVGVKNTNLVTLWKIERNKQLVQIHPDQSPRYPEPDNKVCPVVDVCNNNKKSGLRRFRAQINHEQRVDGRIDIIIKSVCWTLHFIFTTTGKVSGKIHHARPSRRTLHNSPLLILPDKSRNVCLVRSYTRTRGYVKRFITYCGRFTSTCVCSKRALRQIM